MSTSHNALVIEDQLSEAACHLSDAIEKFKNAIAAVESAEDFPSISSPELNRLQGLIEIGHSNTSDIIAKWRCVRFARETEEARIKQVSDSLQNR